MVSDAMLSFEECFQAIDDPRIVPRCTHSLHSILFVAVAATIAGRMGRKTWQSLPSEEPSGSSGLLI